MRKVFTLGFVLACGGSITSVNGNESTTSLTPTDANQLCNDVFHYITSNFSTDDAAKISCGFQTSQMQQGTNCQQTYMTCLSQFDNIDAAVTIDAGAAAPDCTAFNAVVAKCNTTVGEYTKCLQQYVNAYKSLESQVPFCDAASLAHAEANALNSLSSDCIDLESTCQFTQGVPGQ